MSNATFPCEQLSLVERNGEPCVVGRNRAMPVTAAGAELVAPFVGVDTRAAARRSEAGRAGVADGQRALARDFLGFYFFDQGKLSKHVNYCRLIMPERYHHVASAPNTVSFLLSNACNMRCVHCYNDSGRVAERELESSTRLEIADYIARWGVRLVALTGGEPLIHKDALPIMRRLAEGRIQIRISTNAWTIGEEVLELVRSGTIYKINLSLDGANEDSHDTYRKKRGSFRRVIDAMAALRGAGLPLMNLSVAVYDDNLDQLDEICEIAGRMGATSVSFKPVTMSARKEKASRGSLPLADGRWSLSQEGMAVYRRRREELRARYQTATLAIEGTINSAQVSEEEADPMDCHGAEEALFIASNGDLTPCELVTAHMEVPNIRSTSLIEAWLASQAFDGFRAMNSASRQNDPAGRSGCPAMRFERAKAQAESASGNYGGGG